MPFAPKPMLLTCLLAASPCLARAAAPVALVLKDHHFVPAEITVPANARFRLQVTNQDSTPAEFESADLRAEKIVVPGGTATVMAGPLKPGTYSFVDDYHPQSARGSAKAE
jgi:heme/copper-type cytochrome/quinol oxidase subunit 2